MASKHTIKVSQRELSVLYTALDDMNAKLFRGEKVSLIAANPDQDDEQIADRDEVIALTARIQMKLQALEQREQRRFGPTK